VHNKIFGGSFIIENFNTKKAIMGQRGTKGAYNEPWNLVNKKPNGTQKGPGGK